MLLLMLLGGCALGGLEADDYKPNTQLVLRVVAHAPSVQLDTCASDISVVGLAIAYELN